jgi:hypothetical protein
MSSTLIQKLYSEMVLPDKVFSDRDPKFTSLFCTELYSLLNVRMAFITAYNALLVQTSKVL